MTAPGLGLWPTSACGFCRAAVRVDAGRLFAHTVTGELPSGSDRCLGSGTVARAPVPAPVPA